MSWRAWRWNRDMSADLWKEPPLYRRCSPSHTNTIWLPLTRRRRPHTCTTRQNTWRLWEIVLNQSTHLYLGPSDAAAFREMHLPKFGFADFYLLCICNKRFSFLGFFFPHAALMDWLKPLIWAHYNVQMKGFPDPLHSLTSDPTSPYFSPSFLSTLFHFLLLCVWLFFAVQPSMKTHWKTTSRKLVNCVKSKQRISEKIDRWEGWFSFQGSKVRLSIDTSSDSWYFRSMLDRCRELRPAPDWFWSFSDFIPVTTYVRSQEMWVHEKKENNK